MWYHVLRYNRHHLDFIMYLMDYQYESELAQMSNTTHHAPYLGHTIFVLKMFMFIHFSYTAVEIEIN